MGKIYRIRSEESAEIRERMKTVKNKHACRRLEVLTSLGEGKAPKEVAGIKGYHEKHVRNMRREYCENGIESFLTDGRKGGNHLAMKDEQIEGLISGFKDRAKAGQMITIEKFAKALDEATGKECASLSAAYYILHRHGWRKIMPRSKHPNKANDKVIEASKKLTHESRN